LYKFESKHFKPIFSKEDFAEVLNPPKNWVANHKKGLGLQSGGDTSNSLEVPADPNFLGFFLLSRI
jgi:hypothetical protein